MRGNIIFVSGVHGVGKTTICNEIKKKENIEAYSSSELIRKYSNEILDAKKEVNDVSKNQNILIESIKINVDRENIVLLDGHFVLLKNDHSFENVPLDTFKNINLAGVIMIVEEAEVISQRLRNRDSKNYDIEVIDRFQNLELQRAKEVCEELNIDIIEFKSGNDINKIISFINRLKKD